MKLVKLHSQQLPTFLLFRGHRSVVQQCCVRLHSTSNNVARRTRTTCHVSIVILIILFYSHTKTQLVVTCCERLHTSANIAQQETTMLAQQCCVLLRAFARAFTVTDSCRSLPRKPNFVSGKAYLETMKFAN